MDVDLMATEVIDRLAALDRAWGTSLAVDDEAAKGRREATAAIDRVLKWLASHDWTSCHTDDCEHRCVRGGGV